jgi:CO dehydrogenase maturation factor
VGEGVQARARKEIPLKVSICGKGGSGKSTLAALLAREFRRRGMQVLVIDSDESNAGLYRMLGIDGPPTPLMELAGGRKNYRRALGAEGDSILARDSIRPEDIPAEHMRSCDGLRLVSVGKIHQALEGCACPIGALSRAFLKRLALAEGEVAVVDMEAGVEHFGRGVETSVDSVVAVVEPSLESVSLGERVKELASASGARFAGAVLNKVGSEGAAQRLEESLAGRGITVLGVVRSHPEFVDAALAGGPVPLEVASEEIAAVADAIVAAPAAAGVPERPS